MDRHPGSVAVYLRLAQDHLAMASLALSASNFVQRIDFGLMVGQLYHYPSTRRLTQFFGPRHWQLLRQIFLEDEPVFTPSFDDRPVALEMAEEGLLMRYKAPEASAFSDEYTFRFVSPVAREMARLVMVDRQKPRVLPTGTFDMSDATAVLDSLKTAIRFISREPLMAVHGNDPHAGAKKSEVNTEFLARDANAPNELTFHSHLLSVLHHWVTNYRVHVAVPVGVKTKPDLVISSPLKKAVDGTEGTDKRHRVLVELVSHARLNDMKHNGVCVNCVTGLCGPLLIVVCLCRTAR